MAENDMNIANQNTLRDLPTRAKVLPQPTFSLSKTTGAVEPTRASEERPPPQARSKPKQSYLKRGTGLHNRLVAAKQKRYVPKGGFIKGQGDDDAAKQGDESDELNHCSDLGQAAGQPVPITWPQGSYSSLAPSEKPEQLPYQVSHSLHQHDHAGVVLRQQPLEPHQPYTTPADLEAELDADSALVQFPADVHQSRQADGTKSQLQNRLHDESDVYERSLQTAYANSGADPPGASADWQLQQAAEALELEEFQALERQITQDSGMSVRGSLASVSAGMGKFKATGGLRADMHIASESQHRQPRTARSPADQQASLQPRQQATPQYQVNWQQLPASQLAASATPLHDMLGAINQAPRQTPPGRVTGNPFAEPDELSRPATAVLPLHDGEDNGHEWIAQAPAHAGQGSRAQSSDQPQSQTYAEPQNSALGNSLEEESAWGTGNVVNVRQRSDATGQSVQDGLHSTRASQSYIQGLFRRQQPQKTAIETKEVVPTDSQSASIAALEQEMQHLQDERSKVSKLRTQLEQASTRLEQEKTAWEQQKSGEAAAWEAEKEADSQRLKRHQRVLDKQSRALLKLPNRKERSEVEAVEAVLEQERKAGNAKDARHKLTVERLRQKLVELQDTNAELREEVRFHEQRRLEDWNAKENQQPAAGSRGKAAGGPLSEATSTNRSKPTSSPQEASSKPPAYSSQAAKHLTTVPVSQPDLVGAHTASQGQLAQAFTAGVADGASDADYEDIREAQAGPLPGQAAAFEDYWHKQRQHSSGHLHLPSQQANRQTEQRPHTSMQTGSNGSSASRPAADAFVHVDQPMDAFQPIANMQRSDLASWGTASAATQQQQGRQAEGGIMADRYQHATALDSPDDFTWQPIHPRQAGTHSLLEASQSCLAPSAEADSWGAAHMGPDQHSLKQGDSSARSLRQSLDAAARLDARLQGAQQPQQQRSLGALQQQAEQQLRYSAAAPAVGGNPLWQDLQGAYRASQPALPEGSASQEQYQYQYYQQQQQQEQQHQQQQHVMGGMDGQFRSTPSVLDPVYDRPFLMDRSRPQTAADVSAVSGTHPALPVSTGAQALPDSWAAYTASADCHQGADQAQRSSRADGHAKRQAGSSAVAQQGPAHALQDYQQRGPACDSPLSASAAAEKPYQELSYPDGKVEQIFLDGRRTVVFGNGTRKHQFPDGHTAIRFTNRDIKRFYPCGRVEYYYCEVDTWHTTHASGIEVFYFPNGQTEAHHPSGTKDIIFTGGVIRRVFTDGREQDVTPEQLSSPVKHPMPEDTD